MTIAKKLLLLVLLPLVLLGAALEGLGRWLYRPAPPDSAQARTQRFNDIFYEYDRDLVVRLRPEVQHDFRAIRPDLGATVTINPAGFRGPAFVPADPEALRIAVFGDSVSFGFGVADDEAWPARLRELLAAKAGTRPVQLRNYAVPGYTTTQGRLLFERHVLAAGEDGEDAGPFDPHVVLFAFGFNDGYLRPQDDRATLAGERFRHESWPGRLVGWLAAHSRLVAWLTDPGELAPRTPRVSYPHLLGNLELVAATGVREGIDVVLIDSCLPHCYARRAIETTAAAHGVPAVSFRDELRERRGLSPEGVWPAARRVRVVLPTQGVTPPASPDGSSPVELVVLRDAAERPAYVRLALTDDGEGADLVAGDSRWSGWVSLAAGNRPELAVRLGGLAETVPQMRDPGLLLNGVHLQQPGPEDAAPVGPSFELQALLNVCPWPELMLMPDVIHPNAAGHQALAEAMLEVVLATSAGRELPR
ncbi:MAG: GDSL-type esterase/lipase family protein [Planctomycetota bacterium]